MEDEKIIELYWQRNEEALAQTSQKYGAFCYHIAHNILKDGEDSRECVNDTWFKAWMSIPPKRPAFFQAFLGKITRNLSLDRYRRSRAAKRGNGALELVYEELEECIGAYDGMEKQTESLVVTEALRHFLEELSHDARIIFIRRYWYADSIEEIAKRYGMSTAKVKSALMRSRNRLKEFLEKEGIVI